MGQDNEQIKETLANPEVQDFLSRSLATPQAYYRLNQNMEEIGSRLRTKQDFERLDVVDRYEYHLGAVSTARQELEEAVGLHQVAPKPIGVATNKWRRGHKQANESPVDAAAKAYRHTADAAFDELFFWARDTEDPSMFFSYVTLTKDPVLASYYLAIHDDPGPRLVYGYTGDAQRMRSRESSNYTKMQDARRMIFNYAETANRAQLSRENKAATGVVSLAVVATKALLGVGRARRERAILDQLRAIASMPSVEAQVATAVLG
ncbi:MAG: hypothetical protein JWO35_441 [Candidatus Saccharibacteria bacterium]|nr:hypothetical protein [Candidatus Saccharibacteria bacterium]